MRHFETLLDITDFEIKFSQIKIMKIYKKFQKKTVILFSEQLRNMETLDMIHFVMLVISTFIFVRQNVASLTVTKQVTSIHSTSLRTLLF